MSAEAAPRTAARKRKQGWAIAAIVLVLVAVVAAGAYAFLRPKGATTTRASTATVERRTIEVLVSGTGSAVVADSVTVNPQISGTVKKLYVSLGETVTAGDKLYKISSEDVDTQLLQAKAKLIQSKESRTQAKHSLQQAQNQQYSAKTTQIKAEQTLDDLESQPETTAGLDDRITLAKRELKSAKKAYAAACTGVASAKLGVEAAEANLDSAQQTYDDAVDATDDTVVTAPIDGVVTALPISVGSEVSAGSNSASGSSATGGGSTASDGASGSTSGSSSGASASSGSLTISDVSTLEVQISVSEVDVTSLVAGQQAEITFDAIADKVFVGTVSLISPNGSSSSGVVSYGVDLTLAEQDPRLKPDMTATADIRTLVAENVLAVPNAAVKSDGDTKYVEVVGKGGTTSRAVVALGTTNDTYTEIESGVAEGAAVSTGSTASASASSPSSSGRAGGGGGFMMGGPPGGGGPGGD